MTPAGSSQTAAGVAARPIGRADELPVLGVGITWSEAIEPALEPGLIDFIEIEPQTVWLRDPLIPEMLNVPRSTVNHLHGLPGRKLIHSIGAPVGGRVRPDERQVALLRSMIEEFGSPWASDHLSFNATPEFSAGFFLPPRQTVENVECVAAAVRELRSGLGVPLAIETGVNYLRPRDDELPDGEFVARVAESADCGLLLDIHNVFANSLNGRQSLDEFLRQLPLERVWEMHIAGGMELDGYWLDAHSGAIPDALFDFARELVPSLPNLRAITFEMFPSFVESVGIGLIRDQLVRLRELWDARLRLPTRSWPRERFALRPESGPSGEEWERTLGSLVIGRATESSSLARELSADRGVPLVRGLIHEFRGSMVVGVLRLTSRLLMLAIGPDLFRRLLEKFWERTAPCQYAVLEAAAFADFLRGLELKVPHLRPILEFEQAVVQTLVDQRSRVVSFEFDPLPLLRGLSESRLPEIHGRPGHFEIEVTPDGPGAGLGLDAESLRGAFPYH